LDAFFYYKKDSESGRENEKFSVASLMNNERRGFLMFEMMKQALLEGAEERAVMVQDMDWEYLDYPPVQADYNCYISHIQVESDFHNIHNTSFFTPKISIYQLGSDCKRVAYAL
jgi:hypothetical protein